jgi:hypothetical protein
MLVGASAFGTPAQALTVDEVAAEYAALGYDIDEIRLRINGTIKIEAYFDGVKVEMIVDAETGATLRFEAEDDEEEVEHEEDEDEHDEDEDEHDEDEGEHEEDEHEGEHEEAAPGSDD